jgi:hypothetical protein
MIYKGTLRHVFIRVYRVEIQTVMLVFSAQLCKLVAHLPFSLVQIPPPFPVWISIQYTRIQYVRGGVVCGSGSQTDKHPPQSPFTGKFF